MVYTRMHQRDLCPSLHSFLDYSSSSATSSYVVQFFLSIKSNQSSFRSISQIPPKVYSAGTGVWALPALYMVALSGASAIVYSLDVKLTAGAFFKWIKYSGNQVTKTILPLYSTHQK